MLKKLTVILVLLMFVFSVIPVSAASHDWKAAQEPVVYKSEIKVTENGGVYKVGFATIKFPKGFVNSDELPAVIEVQVYAENGEAYIEFSPDMPDFIKDVTISAHTYDGLLYDKAQNKNIGVYVKSQKFKVSHFSRYAFS